MTQKYAKYKKPSPINLVSICFYAILIGAVYAAWKFVPVYYMSFQVDSLLSDIGYQSADLRHMGGEQQQREGMRLLQATVNGVRALGVDDPKLRVEYGAGFNSIMVDYTVVVRHPFEKFTVLHFHRVGKVPGGGGVGVSP